MCRKSDVPGVGWDGEGEDAGKFYCFGCWSIWECKVENKLIGERVTEAFDTVHDQLRKLQVGVAAVETNSATHQLILKLLEDQRNHITQLEARLAAVEVKTEQLQAAPVSESGMLAETHTMVLKLLEDKAHGSLPGAAGLTGLSRSGLDATPPRKDAAADPCDEDDARSDGSTDVPTSSTAESSFSPGRSEANSDALVAVADTEPRSSWLPWFVASLVSTSPCVVRTT